MSGCGTLRSRKFLDLWCWGSCFGLFFVFSFVIPSLHTISGWRVCCVVRKQPGDSLIIWLEWYASRGVFFFWMRPFALHTTNNHDLRIYMCKMCSNMFQMYFRHHLYIFILNMSKKKTKIIQIPVSCVWNFVWPIPTSLLNSQFLSETNSSKVQSVATTCLQAHLHPKLCDYGHITGRYQLPGGPSEILVKKMVGMLGRWMGQCYFQRWMFWCMRKYIYLYLYLYLFICSFICLFILNHFQPCNKYSIIFSNYTFCMHAYIYIHTYVRTYVRTYIHTYMYPCIHPYIHTYIRTYKQTEKHKYKHTTIQP